jgi:hypothetical protein
MNSRGIVIPVLLFLVAGATVMACYTFVDHPAPVVCGYRSQLISEANLQ